MAIRNQLKGKISRFKRRVMNFLNQIILFVVKISPLRTLIYIKTHGSLVKKMDYARFDIYLNIESDLEYEVRLHSCTKEPETIEWIENFLNKGEVFYDVGANVGAYSLVASKYHCGEVAVYAFEPGFPNYSQLCKNIILNGCGKSIIPIPVALSARTAIDYFNYNNLIPGGALHAFGEAIDYKGDYFTPEYKQPVLSFTIDDLIKQFALPLPNHIKIDVDGIEMDVLKGAEETLSNPEVNSIIVELEQGFEVDQVTEFLSGKGFKSIQNTKLATSAATYNYIFVRRTTSIKKQVSV